MKTVDLPAAAVLYIYISLHCKYISPCRLTEDSEQRVRAMECLDVCSPKFSFSRSVEAVRCQSSRMLCDVLLDQAVMPGVGNIIKNEALFDSGLHPAVTVQREMMNSIQHRNTDGGIKTSLTEKRLNSCIIE